MSPHKGRLISRPFLSHAGNMRAEGALGHAEPYPTLRAIQNRTPIRSRGDLSRWASLAGPAVLVREARIPGNITDRRATRPERCLQGQNLAAVDITGGLLIHWNPSLDSDDERTASQRSGSSGTKDLRLRSLMQERRSGAPGRMNVDTGASYSDWLDWPESTQRGASSLQQADIRSRAHCDVPQAFKRALSWMANSPVFETRWQRPL